jgi:molybdopterin synthase catalytic subunit
LFKIFSSSPLSRTRSRFRAKFEAFSFVFLEPNVGRCEVVDVSVAIAISVAHRRDALASCRDVIDELKECVPLWKKELYEGGEEWIGSGS